MKKLASLLIIPLLLILVCAGLVCAAVMSSPQVELEQPVAALAPALAPALAGVLVQAQPASALDMLVLEPAAFMVVGLSTSTLLLVFGFASNYKNSIKTDYSLSSGPCFGSPLKFPH